MNIRENIKIAITAKIVINLFGKFFHERLRAAVNGVTPCKCDSESDCSNQGEFQLSSELFFEGLFCLEDSHFIKINLVFAVFPLQINKEDKN